MNFAKRIYYSYIIILICSTVITIAGIRGFQRLEPFVNTLNSSNTKSLYYSEQMLSSISVQKDIRKFEEYLNLAKNNVTEAGEEKIIEKIEGNIIIHIPTDCIFFARRPACSIATLFIFESSAISLIVSSSYILFP